MRIPNVCRIARVALATEQFVYHVSWYCDGIARAMKSRSNSYIMHFAINYLHGENMRLRDRTAKKNIDSKFQNENIKKAIEGSTTKEKIKEYVNNLIENKVKSKNTETEKHYEKSQ